MNEYMAYSMAWSAVGLAVGYVLVKTEVAVRSLLKNHRSPHDHT